MEDERTRIKLCGLMREEDARAAVALRPDYIGFILSKAFRRYADPAQVRRWREKLAEEFSENDSVPGNALHESKGRAVFPQVVGVFVDEDPSYVIRQLKEGVIDIAQLHGGEDNNYIRQIQEMTDRPVIKAIKIESATDIALAAESPADHILLDAGTGEGRQFNWELAKGVGRDFFLAGGLTPENVAEAVTQVRPFAVDVSSGIETDGSKDPAKMESFVREVRNIQKNGG